MDSIPQPEITRSPKLRVWFLIYGLFFAPASVLFVYDNFQAEYSPLFSWWSGCIYLLANLGVLFYLFRIQLNRPLKLFWRAVSVLWVLHFLAEGSLDASSSDMIFFAKGLTWVLGAIFFYPSFAANFKLGFAGSAVTEKLKAFSALSHEDLVRKTSKFRFKVWHLPVWCILLFLVAFPLAHYLSVRGTAEKVISELSVYRKSHGVYPESLEALSGKNYDRDLAYETDGNNFALSVKRSPYPVYDVYRSFTGKWRGGFFEFFEGKFLRYLMKRWETYHQKHKNHEGLILAQTMLPYITWRYGQEDWMTVEANHRLALSYQRLGDLRDALTYYERAEKLIVKAGPGDVFSMINFFNHYGSLLITMGMSEEAEMKLKRSVTAEWDYPQVKDTFYFAETLVSLGTVYLSQGRLTEARESYEKAQAIYEKIGGAGLQKNTASCYQGLANVFRAERNYQKAEEMYDKAIVLLARLLPSSRYQLGVLKRDMAQLFYETKQYEKARELAGEAIRIFQEEEASSFWEISSSVNLAGMIFFAEGQTEKAAGIFEDLIEELNHMDVPDGAFIQPMLNLAEAYEKLKEFSKAAKVYEDLLALVKPYREDDPNFYLAVSGRLAHTYQQLSKRNEAFGAAAEALAFSKDKKLDAASEEWLSEARMMTAEKKK